MTAMRIDDICPTAAVEIECDGYTPLVARFGGYSGPISWAPKYWRTGNFERSLLEIGVNPLSGEVCAIDLVAIDKFRDKLTLNIQPCSETGIPVTSLSQWSDDLKTIDVKQEIIGSLVDRELTVIFGEAESAICKEVTCGRFAFFLDGLTDLRGFRVKELTPSELDNVRLATNQTGCDASESR